MKHNLTTILMMQGFVKIASLKKLMLAATIMLAAVFAANAAREAGACQYVVKENLLDILDFLPEASTPTRRMSR